MGDVSVFLRSTDGDNWVVLSEGGAVRHGSTIRGTVWAEPTTIPGLLGFLDRFVACHDAAVADATAKRDKVARFRDEVARQLG